MTARQSAAVEDMAERAAASMAWVRKAFARTGRSAEWLTYAQATELGEAASLFDWSPVRPISSRIGGKAGAAMVPLRELAAAGWQLLPLPEYRPGAGWVSALMWNGRGWLVVPPEDSGQRACVFTRRGRAQAWASDCYRAERAGSATG